MLATYDDLLHKLLSKYDPVRFRKQLAVEFQGPLPTLPEELAVFYKEVGPNELYLRANGREFYMPALHRLDDLEQPYQDALVFLVVDDAHWVLYHTSGRVFSHDVKAKRLTKIGDSLPDFLTAFTEIATSDDRQRVETLLQQFGY
ncbi:hypothetical protein [Tumebacillus permanentifrigoris]|uniref:SMI1/KNR4 family protein n=1 Tax=Tumebacillus permanentifrigoris TaxID=378543 RepID=A0A316DXF9_9BACL|nr:hypothetical protein [Tumebacillus permanentifrigoris]PWK14524.1 hypothetical protein C7459_105291 [Tumebacillus permanentifrigoris]